MKIKEDIKMNKNESLQYIIDNNNCIESCDQCYFHMHYVYKYEANKTDCYLVRFSVVTKIQEKNFFEYTDKYKLKKIKKILK